MPAARSLREARFLTEPKDGVGENMAVVVEANPFHAVLPSLKAVRE